MAQAQLVNLRKRAEPRRIRTPVSNLGALEAKGVSSWGGTPRFLMVAGVSQGQAVAPTPVSPGQVRPQTQHWVFAEAILYYRKRMPAQAHYARSHFTREDVWRRSALSWPSASSWASMDMPSGSSTSACAPAPPPCLVAGATATRSPSRHASAAAPPHPPQLSCTLPHHMWR